MLFLPAGLFLVNYVFSSSGTSEIVFAPETHALLVINSNILNIADSLANVHLNATTDPTSSDSIFNEIEILQSNLAREARTLRSLLEPEPPRSPRPRRSIWGWLGLASTSEMSEVNHQLVLTHQRENLVSEHLNNIDQTLTRDHAIIQDLLINEEKDFVNLVNQIRRLSTLQSASHLVSLLHDCTDKLRAFSTSYLQGRLVGQLAAPGTETLLISMGRRGTAVTSIVWSAQLTARRLDVTRDAVSCCTVKLDDFYRTIPCTSRTIPLTSVGGPSHDDVCAVSPAEVSAALSKCQASAFEPNLKSYCPISDSVHFGWQAASKCVPVLMSEKSQSFHEISKNVPIKSHKHSILIESKLHDSNLIYDSNLISDSFVSRDEFMLYLMPVTTLLIISLTVHLCSITAFFFWKRREEARLADMANKIKSSPPPPPQQ